MLAAASDYFQIWHIPLIVVFLFGWIVGGGYLVQVVVGKKTERRKYTLGQGILVSFLSGAGGGFAAMALYMIGKTIFPPEPDPMKLPICWPGLVAGVIGYLVVSFLVLFSMHKLSVSETLSASIIPLGAPLALGILIAWVAFIFTNPIVIAKREHVENIKKTARVLGTIYKTLEQTTLRTGRAPETLEELVEKSVLEKKSIQSPVNPQGRGFFFNGGRTTNDPDSRRILICDYVENFGNKGRTVLYANRDIKFLTPEAFLTLLSQTENQKFSKALQAAESKK